MKCPSCGNEMADDANFCSKCGASVDATIAPCRNCGRMASSGDLFCQKCGADLRMPRYSAGYQYQAPGPLCPHCGQSNAWGSFRCTRCGKKMSSSDDYSDIAGILMLITGIINLASVIFMVVVMGTVTRVGGMGNMVPFMLPVLILMLIFGVVVLMAGWYAKKRQHFLFTVLGAFLGVIGVGGLLSIIAAVLLLISKDNFEN